MGRWTFAWGIKTLWGHLLGEISNKENPVLWSWMQQPLNSRCWKENRDCWRVSVCFKTKRHPPNIYMSKVITWTLGRYFETVETTTDWRCGREANNICIGVSPPSRKPLSFFFSSPLLNLQTTQALLLRQYRPVYWIFHEPLLEVGFFSEPP